MVKEVGAWVSGEVVSIRWAESNDAWGFERLRHRLALWFCAGALIFAPFSAASAFSGHAAPQAPSRPAPPIVRGSDSSPVIVKLVPSEKSIEEIEALTIKEKSDEDLVHLTGDLAEYTKFLFFATLFLAIVTAVLTTFGFFQLRDTKRSIVAAERAADAALMSAKTAERSLIELERPFVYGNARKPGLKVVQSATQPGSELERDALEICIYNFGRTIARLTRIKFRVATAPNGGIVESIDPTEVGGRALPVGTVCALGDPYVESENLRLQFFDQEADIIAGKQSVWIVGFVRYADIFDIHHISGFCEVFDRVANRFVRRGGPNYNYTRVETIDAIPPEDP